MNQLSEVMERDRRRGPGQPTKYNPEVYPGVGLREQVQKIDEALAFSTQSPVDVPEHPPELLHNEHESEVHEEKQRS